MRWLAALLVCCLSTSALAQTGTAQTPAQLNYEITTNLPNNTAGSITPAILRQVLVDMVASANIATAGAGQIAYYNSTGTTLLGNANATLTAGGVLSVTGLTSTGAIQGVVNTATTLATGSTTARTLAARAADVINVKDYGAVCDGTTDDAAAFAAANTAAASAGKPMYVPGGTCRFSTNFSLSVNVNLLGVPGESILKALSSNVANPVLLALTGGNNYIYGITFDGDLGDSIANTGNVVTAFQVANVVFDTDKWQNTVGIGVIFSSNISYSGVRNSQFKSVGNFAAALASRHQPIDFCCGTATSNTNNFATNNDFFDFGLDAISVADQYYFLAANNRFNTSGVWNGTVGVACIYLNGNHYTAVTGNVCYSASGNGIDEISSFDSTITGNTVTLAGQSGISTALDTNVAISGNSISNNNQLGSSITNSGIIVFGVCSNVQIAGNVIADDQVSPTQQYGIRHFTTAPATGSCTNLNVAGNTFAGNVVANTSTNLPGSSVTSPGFAVDGSGDEKIANLPSLTVLPTGNAISTTTSFNVQTPTAAAGHETVRSFLATLGMISGTTAGAGAQEGHVTLYTGMSCASGTGNCWSINPLITMEAGSSGGGPASYTAQGIELDVNNFDVDRPPGTAGPSFGLSISGAAPFGNTSAIIITGTLSTQWHDGIIIANSTDNGIIDQSNDSTMYGAFGSHINGINLTGATFSGNAFLSPGFAVDGTGALTLTRPATATTGISTVQSATGTKTSTFDYNSLFINSDAIAQANAPALVTGLHVTDYVSTGATGNRAAIFAEIDAFGGTVQGPGNGYTALLGFASASYNAGGTLISPNGGLWGSNPQVLLFTGATFWGSATGEEIDVEVQAGASVLAKTGLLIGNLGADAVHGSTYDAAIAITSVTGVTVGWTYGINFSNIGGIAPLRAGSTAIGADTAMTVTHGIDFSNLNCTSDCFKSPGFSVGNSGGITLGTSTLPQIQINGAASAARIVLNATAGQQATIDYYDGNVLKWQWGKQTDNSLFLWDNANSVTAIALSAAGIISLGEASPLTISALGNIGVSGAGTQSVFQVKVAGTRSIRYVDSGTAAEIDATNIAQNAFAPITFGGSTTALHTGGVTALSIDGSQNTTVTTYIQTNKLLVANLPVCGAGTEGARYAVTDATATTYNSIVAGTGGNHVPVYCNGTNWVVG